MWPDEEVPSFKPQVLAFQEKCERLTHRVLYLMALALKLEVCNTVLYLMALKLEAGDRAGPQSAVSHAPSTKGG